MNQSAYITEITGGSERHQFRPELGSSPEAQLAGVRLRQIHAAVENTRSAAHIPEQVGSSMKPGMEAYRAHLGDTVAARPVADQFTNPHTLDMVQDFAAERAAAAAAAAAERF